MRAHCQHAQSQGQRPGRRRGGVTAVVLAVLIVATFAGCGSAHPEAHPADHTSRVGSPSPVATTASALPALCRAPERLAPVAAAGQAPSGFRLLDWIRTTLSGQFPTVWGGLTARGPQNELIFQETVRDPALEGEVARYFPAPVFELVPYSSGCLDAIQNAISPLLERPNDPLRLISVGIGNERVEVGSSACTQAAAASVLRWFQQRYGDTVTVTTCQAMIEARPATAPVGRATPPGHQRMP
jgi:hypothetical protein